MKWIHLDLSMMFCLKEMIERHVQSIRAQTGDPEDLILPRMANQNGDNQPEHIQFMTELDAYPVWLPAHSTHFF
jgi:hypothetical protein